LRAVIIKDSAWMNLSEFKPRFFAAIFCQHG
jgi:regulator of extracellular matrix RemA (YlzA/DUF370 family)